MKIGSPLQKIS